MDIQEALALADEAEHFGRLNKYPQALICLARQYRKDHQVTCPKDVKNDNPRNGNE